jgi:hypothetical protein
MSYDHLPPDDRFPGQAAVDAGLAAWLASHTGPA